MAVAAARHYSRTRAVRERVRVPRDMYWRVGKLHLSRDQVGGHRKTRSLRPPTSPRTKHNPFLGFFPTFELVVRPRLSPPCPHPFNPLLAIARRRHYHRRYHPATLRAFAFLHPLGPRSPHRYSPLLRPTSSLSLPRRDSYLMRYRELNGEIRTNSSGPQVRSLGVSAEKRAGAKVTLCS